MGAVAAGVAYALTIPLDSNVLTLFVSVGVYGVVYWGIVLVTGVIPMSELKELLGRFRPVALDS